MKHVKITDKVSYFDALVATEDKLVTYARNKNTRVSYYKDTYKQFPLYETVIRSRFQRGINRNLLMEEDIDLLRKSGDFQLPILVMYEIFSYLSLEDLIALSRACGKMI